MAFLNPQLVPLSYAGLTERDLVLALYHGTQPLGMGVIHDQPQLTSDDIPDEMLTEYPGSPGLVRIDYLFGRPLKIDIDIDAKLVTTKLYDRDAGPGAAAAVIAAAIRRHLET